MVYDSGADDALDAAVRRLERALGALEQRLSERLAEAKADGGLFDHDHAQLAADLERSRTRERELEAAGAAASAALGRAIVEIKAALGDGEGA